MERQECKTIPREQCVQEAKEECNTVTRQVPRPECTQESKEVCTKVPREVCEKVPNTVCSQVPTQECRDINREVSVTQDRVSKSYHAFHSRSASKFLKLSVERFLGHSALLCASQLTIARSAKTSPTIRLMATELLW